MTIAAADVEAIASELWTGFVGLPLAPAPGGVPGGACVIGFVNLRGAWNGAVLLHCSRPLAVTAAARLFAVPEDVVGEVELGETVRELSNILAGNLKRHLPPPVTLAVPGFADGLAAAAAVPAGREVAAAGFVSGGEPVRMTVLEQG